MNQFKTERLLICASGSPASQGRMEKSDTSAAQSVLIFHSRSAIFAFKFIYIYIHNHLHEKLLRMFALVVSILATTTEVAQCSHLHISCSWLQACAAQSPDPTQEKYVSPMSPKHCFQKTNTCEIATKFDAFKIANTVLRTKCSQTHIEGTCPMPHVPETLLTQKENHCVYHIWSRPQFQRP